ncbi:MAG: DUF2269 domain-containing protein [Thermoplasmatales archaeon]
MTPLIIFLLFIHVISAVFLVGSSIFVWIVIWPASSIAIKDEKLRTRFMSVMGKRYALYTNITIILLTITGLLLVALYYPVYFYNIGYAVKTRWGYILTIKISAVAAMYAILYGNNLWHGKLIPKLAEAGKFEELKNVRKIAHVLSFITVGLMIAIVLIAEILAGVFF